MARRPDRWRRSMARGSGGLLFLLALPLGVKAILSLWQGDFTNLLVSALLFLLLFAGALLTRRGVMRDAAKARRRTARPSGLPLKNLGAALIALGTALTAYLLAGYNLAIAVCFGLGALLGYFLAYGFDARRQTEAAASHGVDPAELAAALDEANAKIDRIEAAGRSIRTPEFNQRLRNIIGQARKVLEVIEDDPRDLRRARKFLKVYLDGAQGVTEKYAKTHKQVDSEELESNFRDMLVNMENVCAEQYEKLLENDVLDLDVQIEVLTLQLKREGVI